MKSYLADFRLGLLILIRSRWLLVTVILGTTLAVIAWLAGQFSPRQPATVALDVGISFVRLVVPLLGLLQIQELMAREVDRRLILTSLTYPRSRATFLLGRFAAVAVAAITLAAILAVVLGAVVSILSSGHRQATGVSVGLPFAIVMGLIGLDVVVVLAFGAVLATVATTPHLVFLAGIGFMIIARSASTIVALLQTERELVIRGADLYQQGLQWVQWLIPDLASLDVRPIALYGKMELLTAPVWALVGMPLAYVSLLLALACMRFDRRQFN